MAEWLRVKDKDVNVVRTIHAEELSHGNYQVLKQNTHDPVTGDMLPPEHLETPASAPTSGPAAEKEKN